jgi:DNA-binding IclR family transcriptional regulator
VGLDTTTIRPNARAPWDTGAMADNDSFSEPGGDQLLTSVEVAAMIGCRRASLNRRLLDGTVPGYRTASGRWLLDAAGLTRAKAVIRPGAKHERDCLSCHQLGDLLCAWRTGTVAEITPVIGIHEGNVRKHLNHLAAGGLAIRRLDGAWELTERGWEWMAGVVEQLHPTPPDHVHEDELHEEVDRTG